MAFLLTQFLTGLAQASALFLVAAGLSVIFGVTRIVNFAHGAFAMLGAYAAVTLTTVLGGPVGFWAGLLLAALLVAALGALLEGVLLRRLARAPALFQLLATFGVTLMVEDIVVLVWGPEDLLGPRAPGLVGGLPLFGRVVPRYDLFLIAAGPAVLGLIWLVFHRTRFGVLVRAATQDREMVAALGVNARWLFTGVFALGVFLAALGGALSIPREAVNHGMDLRIVVDAFVVVVIGGLGSIGGAYLAAVIVAELNAFGILLFPGVSLVLAFAVMALVLTLRPHGLLGRAEPPTRAIGLPARPWQPWRPQARAGALAGLALLVALPAVAGPYGLSVGAEILTAAIFAASLQLLISAGGLVSFGHAAFFGLGVYGAALAATALHWPMLPALLSGTILAGLGAAAFGLVALRLSGVSLAMLTLAFAQILWSVAFQWTSLTGGDNGLLGVWPDRWAASPATFYWLCLGAAASGVAATRFLVFSPLGFGLRALRDAPARAEAVGFDRRRTQGTVFALSGALAGLAGALFVFAKGSAFPDALGIGTSVDGLVMVLLGGVGTVSGAVAGAVLYKALSIWLVSHTDLSKLVLGATIVGLVLLAPAGLGGLIDRLRWKRNRPLAAARRDG